MIYKIEITSDAKLDMELFDIYERKIIITGIKEQLTYEPLKETRNRKKLRDNPLSAWELNCCNCFCWYKRIKEHNALYVRNEEIKI